MALAARGKHSTIEAMSRALPSLSSGRHTPAKGTEKFTPSLMLPLTVSLIVSSIQQFENTYQEHPVSFDTSTC